ncbi:MAG: tetratricopeptide repeat protein [Pseudomonadota bacterium]|nr:tetratricopeptide repeat protein [Pseudomonadota bacterium]MDP1906326.1 tetratricopeptide repeat protein [Pseudomonadota bacterium]MDP2352058.1 tetratricopeptide repeat protein [Pseudomonadota bacterium]
MRSALPLVWLLSSAAIADDGLSAHALYQRGQYAQAQTRYAQEGGYAGQFGAGAAAWKLNDYRAATTHFGAALLLARDARQRDDALYNLGNAHYGQSNWRAAVEAYTAVLLARPQDAKARANLEQARVRLAKQGGTPFDSDLRGRRGQLAQGEVNLDWESERAVRELAASESVAMVGGGTAAGARLQGASGSGSGADIGAARLQSGLKKLELLGDRPQAMLKGLLRQDRGSSSEQGGEPW